MGGCLNPAHHVEVEQMASCATCAKPYKTLEHALPKGCQEVAPETAPSAS